MLLLLGLSTAAANNRCAVFASAVCELSVDTFVYSVCACSRTYGASSRELRERHASCDILLSLLLQLRLLRLLRVLPRTAAAAAAAAAAAPAAAAVYCRGFLEVGLPEAANNNYKVLASGPVEQGFVGWVGHGCWLVRITRPRWRSSGRISGEKPFSPEKNNPDRLGEIPGMNPDRL